MINLQVDMNEENKMKIRKAEQSIRNLILKDWNQEAVEHLHFDDGFTFVAKIGSGIVGFISAKQKNKEETFIDIIDVKEKYRRQGIGSALVDAAIMESKNISANKIKSWSSLDKIAAIEMWESLGFKLHLTETISKNTKSPVKGYIVEINLK